jgi:ABC-type transport system substrate-binding protein
LIQAGYRDINNDGIREMPDGQNSLIFKIFYPAAYPSYLYVKVVEVLTEDFNRIGVNLKPLAINEGDLVEIINPGFNHDLALWGWSVNPDPDFILSIFTTGQIRGYNSETGFSILNMTCYMKRKLLKWIKPNGKKLFGECKTFCIMNPSHFLYY